MINVEYLYNIINLYLKNEHDTQRTVLNIIKKDGFVEFKFNMDINSPDKTTCKISLDDVNAQIWNILNIYKQDIMIIDEKYNDKKNIRYEIIFQNGRKLSFTGFSPLEINRIRNILYNITIDNDIIRLPNMVIEEKPVYKPLSLMQQAGFIATSNIFLIVLYTTDLFAIILWVFKELTK